MGGKPARDLNGDSRGGGPEVKGESWSDCQRLVFSRLSFAVVRHRLGMKW